MNQHSLPQSNATSNLNDTPKCDENVSYTPRLDNSRAKREAPTPPPTTTTADTSRLLGSPLSSVRGFLNRVSSYFRSTSLVIVMVVLAIGLLSWLVCSHVARLSFFCSPRHWFCIPMDYGRNVRPRIYWWPTMRSRRWVRCYWRWGRGFLTAGGNAGHFWELTFFDKYTFLASDASKDRRVLWFILMLMRPDDILMDATLQ